MKERKKEGKKMLAASAKRINAGAKAYRRRGEERTRRLRAIFSTGRHALLLAFFFDHTFAVIFDVAIPNFVVSFKYNNFS